MHALATSWPTFSLWHVLIVTLIAAILVNGRPGR